MKYIILLLFFIPFLLFSYEGKWEILDSVDSAQWKCIDCYDSLNCVVFGNDRFTEPYNRVTSDGGRTWVTTLRDTQILGQYYPEKVIDVAYPDSNLCVAVCGAGYYWISTDKCQSWERKRMPTGRALDNIHFYDKNYGLIQTWSEIFLTSDGGKTWDYHNINNMFASFCSQAKIVEPGVVFSIYHEVDHQRIIKTYDWGKTWVLSDTIPGRIIANLFPLNKDTVLGIGGSKVLDNYYNELIIKTYNGFKTFEIKLDTIIEKQNGILKKGNVHNNKKFVYVFNSWGHNWKTLDAGETWFYDSDYPKEWGSLGDVFWLTENRILAANDFTTQIIMYTEKTTGAEEVKISTVEDILISPNPATDYIEITLSNHPLKDVVERVRVYDVLGVEHPVSYSATLLREGNMRLDVSYLSPSVYFVQVGNIVQKFVKL